jgi:hypothetical protein
LFATAALKVLSRKDPYNYLTLIYTEWAMLVSPSNAAYRAQTHLWDPQGIMMVIYIYIPESPCE